MTISRPSRALTAGRGEGTSEVFTTSPKESEEARGPTIPSTTFTLKVLLMPQARVTL